MSLAPEVLHAGSNTGESAKPILEISNLWVSHNDQQILRNINLDIPKGKITTFLGPSGCGKTTLLKSINRLTDLHSGMTVKGSIRLNGQDILGAGENLSDLRQKMGLLSQRP